MKQLGKETLKSWLGLPGLYLIDVRCPQAFARSIAKIEQAHRIEPDQLASQAQDIPKGRCWFSKAAGRPGKPPDIPRNRSRRPEI